MLLLLSILLPVVAGAVLPMLRLEKHAHRSAYVLGVSFLTTAVLAWALWQTPAGKFELIQFADRLTFSLSADGLARIFAVLVAALWPLTALYATSYMKDAKKQDSFYAFFLMSYGVTLGIALSANLLTLYLFYEMLSLSTLPLVMHYGGAQAVKAGLKYLYYSLGGAAFAFIGLVYVVYFGGGTDFVYGGLFTQVGIEHSAQLRLGYLLCFLGFSVKAAVFPVHGWLPTASVAPTPITALLHAVAVVKSGVFAIIRITYYSFGTAVLVGSYAQYVPLALVIFTIVYGSGMALKEKGLKRRLAYSTVSNLSYILLGVLLMSPRGLHAGLLHMLFHSAMKITLFLAAGIYITRANVEDVRDLRGLAQPMPLTSAAFVLGGLALTGIPPLLGFVSKWSLAMAGVSAGWWLPWLGVGALLISAILTGIYMLSPAVVLYTGRRAPDVTPPAKAGLAYGLTMAGLIGLMLVLTVYNQPLMTYLARVASGLI